MTRNNNMRRITPWIGGTHAPNKPTPKTTANDPQVRLARFKRSYHSLLQLCNRPRNPANEGPILQQLHSHLDRIALLIREESRAPAPHLSLQFASSNQVYTVCARAATVSHNEPVVQSSIAVYAALVDSEEEDFLSSAPFAKSLMRLVRKVIESGTYLINVDTETAILELLFTISAKIRLQPEILSFWFQSTAKPELEDVFIREKKSFVGITQKDDFPLCYMLIDRVHHEGRIGDFARTGLLYIFEATGRSVDLEEWIVSSDIPTLMASGLGALYSQLSRELSILHPDATLPAVLAMSDYSTTHARATAESVFSERHQGHMATFLSYLAFWQDVLDHCKSGDVKQTLLDHFQILFLQQLLYPSLLQSSDTDAGSSVAVLTYITAMLESLEHPDLMHMMLAYLLAVDGGNSAKADAVDSPAKPPRSPTTLRRRQSLMLLTAPKDPDDAVEPTLFNLVDLIMNNISSKNSQSVFAALKLTSTLLNRQKSLALSAVLKVQSAKRSLVARTTGALDLELEKFTELVTSLHEHYGLEDAYSGLIDDMRLAIEAQVPLTSPTSQPDPQKDGTAGRYRLSPDDHLLRALRSLSRTFFTNSVDVNLALTQTIISIALCIELRLDSWLAIDPTSYSFSNGSGSPQKPWQTYLDKEEDAAFAALQQAARRPAWSDDDAPMLYQAIKALSLELDDVRIAVPNLDQLILGRKNMLQATSLDAPLISSDPPSLIGSPTQVSFLDVPKPSKGHRRSPSQSSLARGRNKAANIGSPHSASLAGSQAPEQAEDRHLNGSSTVPPTQSIFLPPPPETPSTTDVLMQEVTFPSVKAEDGQVISTTLNNERKASLNHLLTNVVVLQEFVLELVAVLQVRASVLGEQEVKLV
ncbi:hypothetical protein LTR37_013919 [Vermiconidia calcicola]|uniref:Uncharacterized protein n=1 Tax=Vermiconidia calcicola TaxID=1690605 RepID=A0ACC3MY05_9PEZI|nr:hypothetical protein LTR37_013919 [Vermiconidia calcicola]